MKNKMKKATLTTLSGAIIASNVPLNVFADVLEEANELKISETEKVLDLDVIEGEKITEKLDPTNEIDEGGETEGNAEEYTQDGIKGEEINEEVDVLIYETVDVNQNINELVEQTTADEGAIDKTQVIVNIPDATLKSSIKSALGVTTEDVTQADMERLMSLNIQGKKVKDLTGLEYAVNIITLNAGRNSITDITPLKKMSKLRTLILSYNEIEDISSVSEMTELKYFDASYNAVRDISVLENLTNLTDLILDMNDIQDISSLGNLTKLTKLNLHNNKITSVSALENLINLTEITLYSNKIESADGLNNQHNITYLSLSNNNLKDISALESLVNLEELDLEKNQIKDISALENLTNLTYLNLSTNQIEDISALSNMDKLCRLYLNNNRIEDISALEGKESLEELYLQDNQIKKLSLKGMTQLERLFAQNNQIEELSEADGLNNLFWIDLDSNKLKNIPELKNLPTLERLWMGNNQIKEVSGLDELDSLTSLDLRNNQLEDVSGLGSFNQLEELYLQGNKKIEVGSVQEILSQSPTIYELGISINGSLDLTSSNVVYLYLTDSVIEDLTNINVGQKLSGVYITDSIISSLEFLTKSSFLSDVELTRVYVDDYSPLGELNYLRDVYLEDNDILDLSQFKKIETGRYGEISVYDQHAKLGVVLEENRMDNPFIDIDGSYITDIDLPEGVNLSEDGSGFIFENPIIGQSYEFTATSYKTRSYDYDEIPVVLKATFTLKTLEGEVIVIENQLSNTEKEVTVEVVDTYHEVDRITLPDGTEIEGNKATFIATESGDYEIKYVDKEGNEFTKNITIEITPIIPDTPEIEDTDKPTEDEDIDKPVEDGEINKPTEDDKEEAEKPTITKNSAPIITGSNISIPVGYELDLMTLVSVTDKEDGKLEAKIKSSDFNNQISGTYYVTYEATDSKGLTTEKTIEITVRANAEGNSSHSKDVIIKPNEKLDIDSIVDEIAKDKGLTDVEIIENNVDVSKPGDYKVVFEGTNVKKEQEIHSIKVTVTTGGTTNDSVETGITSGGFFTLGGLFTLAGIPLLKRKKK